MPQSTFYTLHPETEQMVATILLSDNTLTNVANHSQFPRYVGKKANHPLPSTIVELNTSEKDEPVLLMKLLP